MTNPGTEFEKAVQRSFGTAKKPDPPGVYVHKPPNPPARRPHICGKPFWQVCPGCMIRWLAQRFKVGMTYAALAQHLWDGFKANQPPHPARFSKAPPYDFLIMWPRLRRPVLRHSDGRPIAMGESAPDGSYTLAIECKSTDVNPTGTPKPLAFSAVAEHQVKGLEGIAAAGGFAGVLWESRQRDGARAVFVPIDVWLARQADVGQKSLPWAVAVRDGVVVERDVARGTKRNYWRMPDLLRKLPREDSDELEESEPRRDAEERARTSGLLPF